MNEDGNIDWLCGSSKLIGGGFLDSVRFTELKVVEIEISGYKTSTRIANKPCLVMWEPIIDCNDPNIDLQRLHLRNRQDLNCVPLSVSSFGEFRKARGKLPRTKPVAICEEGGHRKARVAINRNAFHFGIEQVIRRGDKRRTTGQETTENRQEYNSKEG